MNIHLHDLQADYSFYQAQIDEAVQEVFCSGQFIGGPNVSSFEKQLQEHLQVNNVVSCGNGSDALIMALKALDIQQNDEVIVPAYSFVSPAESVAVIAAKPVFVDIDATNYNLDLSLIEEKITDKTKAIIAVHLFGQTVDMHAVMKLANKYNLAVIEDVAQALGAKLNNQFAGTFGHIGITSFFPSKHLGAYGDGGAVFTNDEELAAKSKQFAGHGMNGKKFYHEIVGINSRLDALQAAILQVKLPYFNNHLQKRRQNGHFYNQHLQGIKNLKIPMISEGMDHTYHQYVIQVKKEERQLLQKHLQNNGIASGIYYPYILPELPAYKTNAEFQIASQLRDCSLAIPVHQYLSRDQQQYIVQSIKNYFGG